MFDLMGRAMICGTLLMLAFMVLLAMPQSRLREIVLPFVGWAVAALSAAYVLSPIDVMPEAILGPFGAADDVIALALGIASGWTAYHAGHTAKQKQLH